MESVLESKFKPGDKVRVKSPSGKRVTGEVTRVFPVSPYIFKTCPLVEYRSFHTGGLYIARETNVKVYDRMLKRQKEDIGD